MAASTTAVVGRQSVCIQSSETAMDARPAMPDTKPTMTSLPVRY